MNAYLPLSFSFDSNINEYEITLYDGCNRIEKRVSSQRFCLCVCARSPCVRLLAIPLTGGYTTTLYFFLDASCQRTFHLYFNFPINQPAPSALQTFTLTDANYGLPIDGTLSFTQS